MGGQRPKLRSLSFSALVANSVMTEHRRCCDRLLRLSSVGWQLRGSTCFLAEVFGGAAVACRYQKPFFFFCLSPPPAVLQATGVDAAHLKGACRTCNRLFREIPQTVLKEMRFYDFWSHEIILSNFEKYHSRLFIIFLAKCKFSQAPVFLFRLSVLPRLG